jgi:hypothetical protein
MNRLTLLLPTLLSLPLLLLSLPLLLLLLSLPLLLLSLPLLLLLLLPLLLPADWIDGLETFIQQIQHKGWLGGWLLPQVGPSSLCFSIDVIFHRCDLCSVF